MSHRVSFIVSLRKAAVMKNASSHKQQLSCNVQAFCVIKLPYMGER